MSFTACVFMIALMVLVLALFQLSFVVLLFVIGIALVYTIIELFPMTLELIIDVVPKFIGLVFLLILFYFIISWLIRVFVIIYQIPELLLNK